jgi:hypothetical protein
MSCPTYTAFGANAESTRLTTLEKRVQTSFLLENPPPPTVCPLKLDPQSNRIVTTQSESRRLLKKVVACPLFIRESTGGSCTAYETDAVPIPRTLLIPGTRSMVSPNTVNNTNQIISVGPGYILRTQQYSNITGINQVTQPVIGVSSGTLIAKKRIALTGTSPFTPKFFRTFGPNTTSSGGPLYVCPPAKTQQDPGVPVAQNVICRPGSRVVG